jgi:hypothetical protein
VATSGYVTDIRGPRMRLVRFVLIAVVILVFRIRCWPSSQHGHVVGMFLCMGLREAMDSDDAVAAGIAAVALAGIGAAAYKGVSKLRNARERLSVAVLGEAGVGKTSLLHLLAGTPYDNPTATNTSTKYPAMKVDVDGRKLLVREGYDVSGSWTAWPEWQSAVQDGYVVYLADARRLATEAGLTPEEPPPNPVNEPTSRVLRDAWRIAEWREELQGKNGLKHWRCVVAVTHRETDPRFRPQTAEAETEYNRQIRDQLDEAVSVLGGNGHVSVTSGSLFPPAPGNRLKDDIIRRLLPKRA